MPQIKISLDREILDFVSSYQDYGYSSKSEIVATALADFKKRLDTQAIIDSAELYQEVYDRDLDLQELTDDAASLCLD
jgi:metal-responsive CopG/Arc/MetJ family transcriptional regulator